jgi:hypothetical protein
MVMLAAKRGLAAWFWSQETRYCDTGGTQKNGNDFDRITHENDVANRINNAIEAQKAECNGIKQLRNHN